MKAEIKIVISMLIWGSMGLIVKNLDLPSSLIALFRGAIGASFLLFMFLVLKKRISTKAIVKNIPLLLLAGGALGVNWILLFEAYKTTTIANATLSYCLAPTILVAVSPLILKERLSLQKVVCILIALLGMAFLSGALSGTPLHPGDLTGIGFGVAAATAYAGLTLTNKFLRGISSLDATLVQLGVASLVLLPYTLLTANPTSWRFDLSTILWLAVLGVVHTGIAFWFYFDSIPKLKTQTIAISCYIDPLSAIILATVILHEPLGPGQIIGAACILGAIFLGSLSQATSRSAVKTRSF